MEYGNQLNQYDLTATPEAVEKVLVRARELAPRNETADVYKLCYGCIDLTSLGCTDSDTRIGAWVRKAMEFERHFSGIPNVASICVYPNFVEVVGLAVGDGNMAITSVSGGFPSSQTFLEVKMLETAMAVENGADEIDIVISVGEFLSGEYDRMANEIEMLKNEVGPDTVLKVILETGELKSPELIRKASLLAMIAGADFIKTSTGKVAVSATPEAAVVMCEAIRDYHAKTGRKVGFKAAGGVRTASEAVLYYTIVETVLGKEWLTPSLFRIGASSLANDLLGAIEGHPVKYF